MSAKTRVWFAVEVMSDVQLSAFLAKVANDAGLQQALMGAETTEEVEAIAKAEGFVVAVESWSKAQLDLSDRELEDAAGGDTTVSRGYIDGKCVTA